MTKAAGVLAFVTVSAFQGCDRPKAGSPSGSISSAATRLDHADLKPKRIQGEILVSGSLYMPFAVAVVGPYLVVADRTGSDSLVKVYRKENGNLVFATGRQGSGPGEYRSIWTVRPGLESTPERPVAWIFDFTLRRLTAVDVSDSGRLVPAQNRPLVALQADATLTAALWENDSTIVTLGFFRDGRLGFFDRNGSQSAVRGELPSDDRSIPAPVLQHAYQSYLALKPDRTLLAVANRHAGRLELFTPTGERVSAVRGPYDFEPVFRTVPGLDSAKTPVFSSDEDLRFGYLALGVTDSHIFALFSGRVRRAFPGQANFGQFLHVFDWAGNFVRAYDLGQAVFTIDVDPSGGRIYAARHDPEPALLVFHLTDPPN